MGTPLTPYSRAVYGIEGVRIECLPYEETLRLHESPKTAIFLDPPYMPETRVETDVYPHEFTFS